ncbi:hypothetical protein K438DRAFT_2086338 [Mycena galopus ATCC 62051]|nr:hypothetical protein K438DRAFT_2086338 [Mycena galopus ATCC 62051]
MSPSKCTEIAPVNRHYHQKTSRARWGGVRAAARRRPREGSGRAGMAKKAKPKTKTTGVAENSVHDAASPCNGKDHADKHEDEDARRKFKKPCAWKKQREPHACVARPSATSSDENTKKCEERKKKEIERRRPDIVRFATATSTSTSSGGKSTASEQWQQEYGMGSGSEEACGDGDDAGTWEHRRQTHGACRDMATTRTDRIVSNNARGRGQQARADPGKMSLWREQQAAGIQ